MAKTPSRSALLARELLARIARRELRPGDPIDLPALGRRHGVSRTVVREALADLGGKGLVVARPKVGTTIAPESQWNLLDPVLVAVAIAEGGPDSMLPEAAGLRRVIEPALAAGAATDASRAQRAAVLDAVRGIAGAVGANDPDALAAADAALHAAIADGCANRLLRSIDHALVPVRALHRQRLLDAAMTAAGPGPEILLALELQTAIGLAIARREPEAAAASALALAQAAAARPTAAIAIADRNVSPGQTASAPVAAESFARSSSLPSSGPSPIASPASAAAASRASSPEAFDPARLPDAANADDWPATRTMAPADAAFAPLRRARMTPDDGSAPAVVVPALLADAGRDAAAFAGLR
jgi:DNA-binding FadR family transcriptional regulator